MKVLRITKLASTTKLFSYLKNIGIACVTFVIVSRLINPIRFDFFTPNHTDIYHYFVFSKTELAWSFISEPRPLSILFIHLIGFTNSFNFFLILLSIPAFLFVVISFIVFSNATNLQHNSWLSFIFYCFVFSSTYFVQVMQLDFGGMLAGFFAVIAIWCFMEASRNEHAALLLFLSCISTVISTGFKPNFPVLVLLVQLIFVIKTKSYTQFLTFAINSVCVLGIYLFDKVNESPFLAVDVKSPYYVAFQPFENFRLIGFYTFRALTPLLILFLLLLVLNLMRLRKFGILLFFAAIIPATSFPISLLINRPWEMYSWYSLIPTGLFLVLALDITITSMEKGFKLKVQYAVLIYCLVAGTVLFSQYRESVAERAWFHYVQDYNQALNLSLLSINNLNSQRILLAGVTGPYHQLKNTEFSKRIYPNLGDFEVILRVAERPWNDMSTRQTNGVYFDEIEFSEFSKIYVFTTKGTLAGVLEFQQIVGLSSQQFKSILFCSSKRFEVSSLDKFSQDEADPICTQSF
jgi:hypothetical protein